MTGSNRQLVVIVFSDIAGFTSLMQSDEDAARQSRQIYLDQLEMQHQQFGGSIIQRLGDGCISVFTSALEGVCAMSELQRALHDRHVPVRVGMHLGDATIEAGQLIGDAVNVAARVESFAVPGSVLLTEPLAAQIRNHPEVDLTSLGQFRFKNVGRPIELFAVSGSGLTVPDRELLIGKGDKLLDLARSAPQRRGELFGRASEVAALRQLLAESRMVTVTGPGGVGKTAVALEVAGQLESQFSDGVAFVSFTEAHSADDFIPTLARALDAKETDRRTPLESVIALLEDRHLLLVLDNLEQIVDAAPEVSQLLGNCRQLSAIATSRSPLRIIDERIFTLAPLADRDAVDLFNDHVRRTGKVTQTDSDDAEATEICRRLDGLPLAIELAAARVGLLGYTGLLKRIDDALDVLSAGRRDADQRQQTLRATIKWSYDLLTEGEREVFAGLSVFAGGFTIDDAEAVTDASISDLDALVDSALVYSARDGRLGLLQTVAAFSREQLEESGRADELAQRHAAKFALMATEVRDGIEGKDQHRAIERAAADEQNLQLALATLARLASEGDNWALETGLKMSGDLWMYWHVRGMNLTARDVASEFLQLCRDATPTIGRVGATLTVGITSWITGDFDRCISEWSSALEMSIALGAFREISVSHMCLSLGYMSVDPRAGLMHAARGLEHSRLHRFEWAEGFGLTFQGILHTIVGEIELADAALSDALAIQERLSDDEGAGLTLGAMADIATMKGDHQSAVALLERSVSAFQYVGDLAEVARVQCELGWTFLMVGRGLDARRCFLDSARCYGEVASVRGVGLCIIGLASVAAMSNDDTLALTLAAAGERLTSLEGIVNVYADGRQTRDFISEAEKRLSTDEVARSISSGQQLSADQAVALAMSA